MCVAVDHLFRSFKTPKPAKEYTIESTICNWNCFVSSFERIPFSISKKDKTFDLFSLTFSHASFSPSLLCIFFRLFLSSINLFRSKCLNFPWFVFIIHLQTEIHLIYTRLFHNFEKKYLIKNHRVKSFSGCSWWKSFTLEWFCEETKNSTWKPFFCFALLWLFCCCHIKSSNKFICIWSKYRTYYRQWTKWRCWCISQRSKVKYCNVTLLRASIKASLTGFDHTYAIKFELAR